MVRLVSRGRYTAVSLPKDLMDVVEEYRKENPGKQYRSNAEFITSAIREKMDREIFQNMGNHMLSIMGVVEKKKHSLGKEDLEFMKRFYGKEKYDELMSGNVPFEQFVKENFGMVLDEKTGKLVKIDPSVIKHKKQDWEKEILVSIENRLSAIEKKLGKTRK